MILFLSLKIRIISRKRIFIVHEKYVPVIILIGSVQRTVICLFHRIRIFLLLFLCILIDIQFSAGHAVGFGTILHLVFDFCLCQYEQKRFTFTCFWLKYIFYYCAITLRNIEKYFWTFYH